jgi:hypothetical protein
VAKKWGGGEALAQSSWTDCNPFEMNLKRLGRLLFVLKSKTALERGYPLTG